MEKKILNKYYNSNNLEQKISRKIFLEKKNEKNKNNSEKHTIHSTTSSLNSKFDNILILDEESNIKDENSLNKEFKKENEETVSDNKIEIIDNFYHNEEIDENIEININNVFLGKKKNRYSN